MYRKQITCLLLVIFSLLTITGCKQKVPKDLLSPPEDSLQNRQMQSRRFESGDEMTIIHACGSVLQDLGYTVDEVETDLGVVVASKTRDAHDTGQAFGAALLAGLAGTQASIDTTQRIRASLVTHPIHNGIENEEKPRLLTEEKITEASEQVYTALHDYLDDIFAEDVCDQVSRKLAEKTAVSLQKDLEVVRLLRGTTGTIVVRVSFQRVIFNQMGRITFIENIKEPTVYQEFYNKLAQSIFLEAHQI